MFFPLMMFTFQLKLILINLLLGIFKFTYIYREDREKKRDKERETEIERERERETDRQTDRRRQREGIPEVK